MNILEALTSPHLFGNLEAFHDLTTWCAWIVLLKATYGLPMTAAELEIFREHTGRGHPLPQGYSEVVAIVGRQSGKSQIAALIAVYEATRCEGRGTYAVLVAQDERAALRTLFRYTSDPFDVSEALRAAVVSKTANTIELETGVSIAAYPCRPAAIRGLRSRVAVCDELAFFRSTEGYATDIEMVRALRPTLATTGGKLIVLSSPYGSTGALWDLHRAHYGADHVNDSTLVWVASAPQMNPTLSADYLQRMEEADPEGYRSEVLGEFRAGLASLFDADAVSDCVVEGRRELLPEPGIRYSAFADPSGGRADAFTVAIGHAVNKCVVVDCVRAWLAPFNPSGVVAEAAMLLRSYRVSSVTGDRFAGEWPRESFRAFGITYRVSDFDRSQLYLLLLPVVMSGGVELLDDPKLLKELRSLERRRGPSGRDRVDHRRGEHDDRANAVAGIVSLLGTAVPRKGRVGFMGMRSDPTKEERHLPGGITLAAGESLVDEGVNFFVVHGFLDDGSEYVEQREYAR